MEQKLPALRRLTVRTSSMDPFGPQKLWGWIHELVPKPGLETLKLHSFTINQGHTRVPRMFILDLAQIHGNSLKHFMLGEAQLTLRDMECLCSKFQKLETIACSLASPDAVSCCDPDGCIQSCFLIVTSGIHSASSVQCKELTNTEIAHSVDSNARLGWQAAVQIGKCHRNDVAGQEFAVEGDRSWASAVHGQVGSSECESSRTGANK